MGVNIHLVRIEGNSVDTTGDSRFDWMRHAGDRDFAEWLHEGRTTTICVEDDTGYREYYEHPENLGAARSFIHSLCGNLWFPNGNRDRLLQLIDLLEADDNLWIEVSW